MTEFIDNTGKPVPLKDFEEALGVVTKFMAIQELMKLPPELAVQMVNIRRCLLQGALLTARTEGSTP